MDYLDTVFYADSRNMKEVPDNSVHLIVTSPPYFNIKDYSKDGYQQTRKGKRKKEQIGDIADYEQYINELLLVWKECERVLKPNGKMAINTPLMPMVKSDMITHYNRHIFDIDSDIKYSILHNTNIFCLMYIYGIEQTPAKN
jgi:site-specific DNA-methyltransferase (cytosine-N4-specific)